jgi:hypothetical protein
MASGQTRPAGKKSLIVEDEPPNETGAHETPPSDVATTAEPFPVNVSP